MAESSAPTSEIAFAAQLFDGSRSNAVPVTVRLLVPETLHISGDGVNATISVHHISVSSRLGNTTRYLTLPDDAKLQTADNDAVDRLLESVTGTRRHTLLHSVEAHWGRVLAALAFTVAFCVWAVWLGLPWLAERTAHNIPVELEHAMGEQSLATLDNHLLQPTRLLEVDRERARRAFDYVVDDLDLPVRPRLALRRAEGLGPNAFALPAGIVILTDEMVEMANVDQELMSVIAHELGHVYHRHIMRSVLQNAAVALVLATLLGDVSSITGLAASIPTVLVEQGYSRRFEFEADVYAAAWLDQVGLDRAHLAAALEKLGKAHGIEQEDSLADYLSTHPGIEDRIEAIQR